MNAFVEHLEQQGLDPLKADIWGEFIGAVMTALLAAEDSLKSEPEWADFCAALGSFGKAQKRGPHANRCLPDEEAISGELKDRMNDFLRHTDEDHILRKWHVTFESEGRVRSKTRKGKFSKRTDIRATGQKPNGPEFVLEAKLIDTPSHVRSRLLGDSGLGCFIGDDPYTASDVAGLLAYTVRGETVDWLGHIESAYIQPPVFANSTTQITVHPTALSAVSAPVSRQVSTQPIIMLNIVLRFETKPI